ncbi:MAG: PAS domain-containing protein [Microscillaceae bacterium]|nr:PAS domain-containing protein [Microscillaceae bacterium]
MINIAGKNRDIVEQIVIYSNQIAESGNLVLSTDDRQALKNNLNILISSFKTNLNLLETGGQEYFEDEKIILPPPPPSIIPIFQDIQAGWYGKGKFEEEAQTIFSEDTFIDSIAIERYRMLNPRVKQALAVLEAENQALVNLHSDLISEYQINFNARITQTKTQILFLLMVNIFFIIGGSILIARWLFRPLDQISKVAHSIGQGDLTQKIEYNSKNEVGMVAQALNGMVDKIRNATNFIKSIEKGDLGVSYKGLNGISLEKDTLAGALINMREKMKAVAADEEARNWATKGLAIFGEILQTYNDDTETLSYEIVSNVVKYLDANQGGLFIVNEDEERNEQASLELIASYAFNRRKYLKKSVQIGEGLVGQVFKDADTIYITDIPENYVDITSGLGGTQPKSVLVVPLKMSDRVYGVIELASFYEIKNYEIAFLEKLSENIASNLYAARANEKTKKLLIESTFITEQMRKQEQEMLRSLKILEETQFEMQKNQEALAAQSFAIKSTLITVEIGMDKRLLSANDLFFKALKYAEDELIGLTHDFLVPNTQIDQSQYERLWRDLKAGIPHYGEYKRIARDGSDVWLKATYSPITDKNGVPYKILKLAFDVTEEKRLRLDFKEQLDSFKRSSAVVEFNLDGKIIDANDNFLEMMEYKREEIIGRDHTIIVPTDEKESRSYKALWHKLRQGSYHIGEVKRITKSGKAVWFQGSFNPILDLNGQPYKIIEFIIDITARKNAEARIIGTKEELQIKEANLTALINNTEDAIYTIGTNYRITLMNESARRFYEKLGETIRISSSVLDVLPRNYYYIWKGYYDRALSGEKFSIDQAIFSEKTNQKFYLSIYFNPILDENEHVTGVAIFSRDITQRKQRELDISEFTKKQANRTSRIIENQKQALARASVEHERERAFFEQKLRLLDSQAKATESQIDFFDKLDCLAVAINHDYEIVQLNKQAKRTYRLWNIYLQLEYFLPDTFPQHKYEEWLHYCDRALEGESFEVDQIFPNHYQKDYKVYSIRFEPIKNTKHEVIMAVISAWDITSSMKKLQEERTLFKQKLRNRLHFNINTKLREFKEEAESLKAEIQNHIYQKSQQEELLSAIDLTHDEVILKVDQHLQIIAANKKMKETYFLWHFYIQPEYYFPDTFPQEKFDAWIEYCGRGFQGKTFEVDEQIVNRKLKKIFTFRILFVPELDHESKVTHLIIKAQDVSHLRQPKGKKLLNSQEN